MVDRLELERRVMIAALVFTSLASVLWLVAISTDQWCQVAFDQWRNINSSSLIQVKGYNIGLWKLCAYLYFNATSTLDALGPRTCNECLFSTLCSLANAGF